MNKTHFTTKVLLSLLVIIVVLGSVVTVVGAADAFKNYNLAYGEIVPTDAKLEKQIFTYNLKGDSDDIYFMRISKGKKNAYFGIEIYADKDYKTQIRSYSKNYSSTAENKPLKVTWDFKSISSGTYYGRCYTFIEVNGVKTIDASSLKTFTINVDRISSKAVKLNSITNTSSGPKITWTTFPTATKYYIYRRASNEKSWTLINTLGANSSKYTDKTAKSGTVYSYTVKCSEGKYKSGYDKKGLSTKYIATPVISVDGVGSSGNAKISWKAIKGASGYEIYRKGGSLSDYNWKLIATIKNGKTSSYVDKTATSSDWQYTYTVKAYSGKYSSAKNTTGVDFDYIAAPKLVKASSTVDGMKIEWKNSNANVIKYIIYRKNGKNWQAIGSSKTTSFIDKTAVSGKTYIYTVKASSDTNSGAYNNTGIKGKYLAAPELKKLTFDSNYRSKVQWTKVPGAAGYLVYRKVNADNKWTLVAEIKNPKTTTYYDNCKKTSGYSYKYTVKAFDKDKKSSQYYKDGTAAVCLGKPKFTSTQIETKDDSPCIQTSWKAIKGATKYNVYRRVPGGTWALIARGTTKLSYLDYKVEIGVTYQYAVRAYNNNGDSSAYLTQNAIVTVIPKLTSVQIKDNGYALTWDAVKNADSYTVYRRAKDSSKWEKIGTSKTNKFTDTSKNCKTTPFFYTVSATFDGVESKYQNGLSNFVEPTVSAKFVAANADEPAYISVSVKCSQAKSFKVYKAINDQKAEFYKTVTGSFTDKDIKEGCSYTYAVAAVADGKVTPKVSASAKFPYAPIEKAVISQAKGSYTNNEPSAKITWKPVATAEKYEVLRKTDSETKWTKLATVSYKEGATSYSYTDKTLKAETVYKYAIKAISSNTERGSSTSKAVTVRVITPLTAVTGLTIKNPQKQKDGKIKVQLSWEAAKYAESYTLYRNDELIYADNDVLKCTDYIEANTQYTYRIVASAPDRGQVSMEKTFIYKPETTKA